MNRREFLAAAAAASAGPTLLGMTRKANDPHPVIGVGEHKYQCFHNWGELPADYVQRITGLKLKAARHRLQQRGLAAAPILCADTTVALGRRILGKPTDATEAQEMLAALSDRSHRVLTAIALSSGPRTLLAMSVSRVTFAPLSAAVITAYIASGEPFGKAGAYAIQSQLAGWIAHIDGSYSAIMGLPLFETAQLLRQARVSF